MRRRPSGTSGAWWREAPERRGVVPVWVGVSPRKDRRCCWSSAPLLGWGLSWSSLGEGDGRRWWWRWRRLRSGRRSGRPRDGGGWLIPLPGVVDGDPFLLALVDPSELCLEGFVSLVPPSAVVLEVGLPRLGAQGGQTPHPSGLVAEAAEYAPLLLDGPFSDPAGREDGLSGGGIPRLAGLARGNGPPLLGSTARLGHLLPEDPLAVLDCLGILKEEFGLGDPLDSEPGFDKHGGSLGIQMEFVMPELPRVVFGEEGPMSPGDGDISDLAVLLAHSLQFSVQQGPSLVDTLAAGDRLEEVENDSGSVLDLVHDWPGVSLGAC